MTAGRARCCQDDDRAQPLGGIESVVPQPERETSGGADVYRMRHRCIALGFRSDSANAPWLLNQKRCAAQPQSDDPKRGIGFTAPGICETADAQACSCRVGASLNQTSTRGHIARRKSTCQWGRTDT